MCILVAKCQLLSSFELYNVYVKCNFGTELPLDKKLIKKIHQCMQFVFNKEKKRTQQVVQMDIFSTAEEN